MGSRHNLINKDSHVLVVGLGASGFSAVKFFKQLGLQISVSDITPIEQLNQQYVHWLEENQIPIEGGSHSSELFNNADCIMVSPGIPLDIEPLQNARHRSVPVVGEMAIAAQYLQTPVVAVTGTNGKTTVTTLLGDIFRHCGRKVFVGGNIGTPLFDYLCGPQDADIVILELSSFQLDTAGGKNGLHPKVALLLNISPDHLDRYRSFSSYASSKFQIFAAQNQDDIAILNGDDPEINLRGKMWPVSRCFVFGNQLTPGRKGAYLQERRIVLSEEVSPQEKQELYDLTATAMSEEPNMQNSMAAILAARLMGCSQESILEGIKNFIPLPHRLTRVAEIDGVTYIDDSKATNIGAVQASLSSIRSKVILIAGGRDKGGDYSFLNNVIKEKVKLLLLIGEAKDQMASSFQGLTTIEKAQSLQEAVYLASNAAQAGEVVLLSPACASFDMFSNYAERGDVFCKAVRALKQKTEH
jgi:UDP-N-acetylmuramoylalanine--D-glutamate ligase